AVPRGRAAMLPRRQGGVRSAVAAQSRQGRARAVALRGVRQDACPPWQARASGAAPFLGPVHTMDTNANGWDGAPIKATQLPNEEAETWRLREEGNAEWRPM